MALYGYARVSTSDQDLTLQTQILRAAGCEIIRAEKASGSGRTGRSELGTVAKLAMRQPFVLFKGLTFQKLCLPGAF
ncbi:recombinase family protein, partial [Salmonella enterica]|uniref:recombinase family protein n=1 Tax=Salmonella enterica TaxID=28901 RepID=UPI00211948E5